MTTEEVQKIIEEMNLRVKKNYQLMTVEQISRELRESMDFERKTFQKIEELEQKGTEQDLVNYARIVCRNTTQREIIEIQEIYLKKIDTEYLRR